MAKITFTKISIENLGPFRERQTLNLNVATNKPVVLIKALNGSGKTTLLTALQISLYGYKAINAFRRSEYEQLIVSLQRKDAIGSSVIEVTLDIEIGSKIQSVTLRREWTFRGKNLIEDFTVLSDGIKDLDFAESWDDFINSILPVELVHLFLFDGEKIEALANPERLPELLRRATEVFLGLGGIDTLSNDLKAVERRANRKSEDAPIDNDESSVQLSNFQDQLEELEKRIAILVQQQGDLKNAVEHAQSELDKFTARAQRQGLAAYQQAAELKGSLESADKQHKAARAALVDAVSDPLLPLIWLGPLWDQYKTQWEQDSNAQNAALLIAEFQKRDKRILSVLRRALPDQEKALSQILKSDLNQYKHEHQSTVLLLPGADPEEIQTRLDSSIADVNDRVKSFKKLSNLLERADKSVSEVPAEAQLSEIFEELQSRSKAVVNLESQYHLISEKLNHERASQALLESRVNSLLQQVGEKFSERTLEIKGLQAANRAKQVLNLFRERLLASKANWLSEMITTEFSGLLRKRKFIAKVVVDPTTYAVSIEDKTGHALPMERLSAGERQILAIAVLSALIRERKGTFPVVVDTPLARLDKKHRESLISNFFSKISHQVMVLSTDEEVDGDAYEALLPYVSQEYDLAFNDDSRSSFARIKNQKVGVAI
ncbi:DNA sulfur modification protein DndD [Undibacterium sp. TJN19]|uniref:DNA sulfur modification protein DndD n=1 Tax=Undibacterium sp. TJN19 TaxID=3413055 RepID=UPI003BF3739B